MSGKEVFHSLPPTLRSYALVGHYLSSFALMEGSLNDALAAALKLDPLQQAIICKNIQLRDKTKTVRTLISISLLSQEEKERYAKLVISIDTLSQYRNMVAHDLFDADRDGDGVEFFVTKASGQLHFPKTTWTVDQVEAKSDELLDLASQLKGLKSEFAKSDLMKALLARPPTGPIGTPPPIGGLFQLGASVPAPPQPPSGPYGTLLEATDAKAPETQQEPRE